MGLNRFVSVCVLWCYAVCVVFGNDDEESDSLFSKSFLQVVEDGGAESRAGHRLKLLFPLLLRISTRLATLVPTALMSLVGILAFVVFSKKALLISLLALFLSLSDKYKNKGDEIYIHKINSYPDYNDEEEHIHYHHWGSKYRKPFYKSYKPYWMRKKKFKRGLPSLPHIPYPIPLHAVQDDYYVEPFKPLSKSSYSEKEVFDFENLSVNKGPLLFPSASQNEENKSGGEELELERT